MSNKKITDKALTPFGIEQSLTRFESSLFHIINVPYAPTVSYLKGAENAPDAILKASEQVELYDIQYHKEPYLKGISLTEINTKNEINKIWADISNEIYKCLTNDKFAVMLGGEHSITHGAIEGCKKVTQDFCILQIDAHCDLREEYLNNPYSHACALRHAFNIDIPITQVGIRSGIKEEYELIINNPQKINTFFGAQVDIEAIIKTLKHNNIYITIDLDGFDPSVIPHVGTPEPGGPGWYDILNLLEAIFNNFKVLAADIVELAPCENSILSDFTTAKLLYKLLCLKESGKN